MKETDKKLSKQNIIIAVLGVALIISIAFGVLSRRNAEKEAGETFHAEFEAEQTKAEIEENDARGIKIPGYSTIVVEAGKKNVSVDIMNPEENEVYFKVKFILSESQELLYESQLIKPGQHLYEIELNRELEAGEYKLLIEYETFLMDGTYSPRNGASVNCILKAL